MNIYELSNLSTIDQKTALASFNNTELYTLLDIIMDEEESLGLKIHPATEEWGYDANNPNAAQINLFEELADLIDDLIVDEQIDRDQDDRQLRHRYSILPRKYHTMHPMEHEAAKLLAKNIEFIRLSTKINQYNPDQIYQRTINQAANNIHHKGGGPCPNDLRTMGQHDCAWAQACLLTRKKVNDHYQEAIPILMNTIHRLDHVVDRIINKLTTRKSFAPKGSQLSRDIVLQVYKNYYRQPVVEWIKNMEMQIHGHRKAEEHTRHFRDWCRAKYQAAADYNNVHVINIAATDLLNNYTRKDMENMALHFGIDTNIPTNELVYQLATNFFDNWI